VKEETQTLYLKDKKQDLKKSNVFNTTASK
jgi:hypothetical protein